MRQDAKLITEPVQQAGQDNNELDLFAILWSLWRGKAVILTCGIIAMFIAWYHINYRVTPRYPATAVIALETREENVVDIESVLSNQSARSTVYTEAVVLKSRGLIGQLVDQLSLMSNPDYNWTLREPVPLKGIDKYYTKTKTYVRDLISKAIGQPTSKERLAERAKIKIDDAVIRERIIDMVSGQISIENIIRTVAFQIKATTDNPQKSVRLANALAEIYIQDALEAKFAATDNASVWLSQKAVELKQELEASEIKLKQFNDRTQLVSPETYQALSKNLKDLRARLTSLETVKLEKQLELDALRDVVATGDLQKVTAFVDDARLDRISQSVTNGIADRAVFDQRVREIEDQVVSQIDLAQRQFEALKDSEARLKQTLDEQSQELIEIQQLQRETQANGLLYESFLTRLKETSVQKGLQRPDSRLLSPAVPRGASYPRKRSFQMQGLLLGLILGAALVVLRELLNNRFRTPDELEEYIGRSVLGHTPRLRNKNRKQILSYVKSKPTSSFSESVRNLRTSLLLSDIDKPPQVVLVTSSLPAEGKTTTALTLAQNMAGLGKRVLIMEGDIRKRVFAEYFDTTDRPGFLAVMAGDIELSEAVFPVEEVGVDVLLGEASTANAADVFSSQKFKDLMARLRQEYDYIIIDSAPVLLVPDARVIAQHTDAVLYAVKWNQTRKGQVKAGLGMFDSVGQSVTGLVMTSIDMRGMKGYGNYGGYGGYGGRYGYTGYYQS